MQWESTAENSTAGDRCERYWGDR